MAVFQEFVCNLSKSKKVRRETMDGRNYLVAPAVLLTHGVHKSAGGPAIYYPESELNNMPSRWDHKPIVVYHPTKDDGTPITACQPAVLESRGCGFFLNTKYDDKLRTELWFDEVKTNKVDKRIITALESETMMEISTGLYMDILAEPGEYQGKKYDGKAQNFAPDHVAILPDKVGACSIKDGGGMLQVNEGTPLIANDTSHRRVIQSVDEALTKTHGYDARLRDVYDGFLIYSDSAGSMFKKSYKMDGQGKVTLGGDSTPVKWVTEYRTLTDQFVGNSSTKEISVDKKQMIDFLVTNSCGWEEGDRKALEGFEDAKLKGLVDFAKKAKETPAPVTPPPTPAPVVNQGSLVQTLPPVVPVTTQPANPPAPRMLTINELPPELQELVVAGQAVKAEIVKGIMQANGNTFREDYLNAQPTEVLRAMARLANVQAPVAAPNYAGQATTAPVINQGPAQKALPEITIDWTK